MSKFISETEGCRYLCRDVVEYATGDHPTFIMGVIGEKVRLIRHDGLRQYLVEGPTNKGNPWWCYAKDLMYTKPMFLSDW